MHLNASRETRKILFTCSIQSVPSDRKLEPVMTNRFGNRLNILIIQLKFLSCYFTTLMSSHRTSHSLGKTLQNVKQRTLTTNPNVPLDTLWAVLDDSRKEYKTFPSVIYYISTIGYCALRHIYILLPSKFLLITVYYNGTRRDFYKHNITVCVRTRVVMRF